MDKAKPTFTFKRLAVTVGGLLALGWIINLAGSGQDTLRANPASSATYSQIENEIGCTSKATDLNKDRIFSERYRDHVVTWTGVVHDVRGSRLELQAMYSNSIGSDFDVDMAPSTDLTPFAKGDRVTVQFNIDNYMGCFMPLRGSHGLVIK
jgi:hypothetical protein